MTASRLVTFHADQKAFLLSKTPGAMRSLDKIISKLFDSDEHPEHVALNYVTEAQKHLSVLNKRERISHPMERVVS